MGNSNKKFFSLWKKSSNTDYARNMLPHNRREVFLDVLKLHWGDFLIYGLLMFVVCLPLNIISINKIYAINDLTEAMKLVSGEELMALAGHLSEVKSVYALMQGASFSVIFLYLAGLIRVIRQYAWEENIYFKNDYSNGFKSNWLQMLLLSIVFGILYSFAVICYDWAQETDDMLQSLSMMIPMCLFLFWVIPMMLYAISTVAVYANSFGNVIKTASAMVFAKPLAAIAASCISCAAVLLVYISNVALMVISRILITIFFPIALLAWMLSSFNAFDKHINAEHFPELVGKGTVVDVERTDN